MHERKRLVCGGQELTAGISYRIIFQPVIKLLSPAHHRGSYNGFGEEESTFQGKGIWAEPSTQFLHLGHVNQDSSRKQNIFLGLFRERYQNPHKGKDLFSGRMKDILSPYIQYTTLRYLPHSQG